MRSAKHEPRAPLGPVINMQTPQQTHTITTPGSGEVFIPNYEISCGESKCPIQVGMLVFVETTQSSYRVYRCTAFMIGADLVMSNGHCDRSDKLPGYFISQKIGGKTHRVPVKGVEFKSYTPDAQGRDMTSRMPDAAVYRLASEIKDGEKNVPVFTLANGRPAALEKLYAWVINPGASADHFTLNLRVCDVYRHEALNPFDYVEAPDVLMNFGCITAQGNSGGPLLASANSTVVEAINNGFQDPADFAKLVQETQARALFDYENVWTEEATNVRCLDIPDFVSPIDCIRASGEESIRRYALSERAAMDALNRRTFPEEDKYGMKYLGTSFELKLGDAIPLSSRSFETVYQPTCRLSADAPTEVTFGLEHVTLDRDMRAQVSENARELKLVNAKVVQKYSNDIFTLEVEWPEEIAPLESPEAKGPREAFGKSFSIAIPQCAR